MHDKPMKESEGTFTRSATATRTCPKCHGPVTVQLWESNCGGFEDEKYTCDDPNCRHVWWVDGPDS